MGPGLECACGVPRSRRVPDGRNELDARLLELPPRRRGRGRSPLIAWMSGRSARAPRYLSQDERIELADLLQSELSVRGSRAELCRAPSTISRELQRNVRAGRRYQPFGAHQHATAHRARHRRRRLDPNADLGAAVTDLLRQRWSPQQISRHPRKQFADNPSMWLCHEKHLSIGYQPNSRSCGIHRWLLIVAHRYRPVTTTVARTSVSSDADRGFSSRCSAFMIGRSCRLTVLKVVHWVRDLIIGNNHLSAIATLVERQTRMLRLVHLRRCGADALHTALGARMQDLPPTLIRSITWGPGRPRWPATSPPPRSWEPVDFCDSRSPWQRGTNEKTQRAAARLLP